MKVFSILVLSALSTTALAAKADLSCVADDFSPVAVSVFKTKTGLKVLGKVNKKNQIPLSAAGTLTSDTIDLRIGSQGGSMSANGFGGIYGVLPVTIPEYGIHALRMTCFSETME